MRQAKEAYDRIEIPEELYRRVDQAILDSRQKREEKQHKKGIVPLKWGIGFAAAFVFASVLGLNTSEAFAMEVQQLPVIGAVARVLTVRNYDMEKDGILVQGEVPELQADGQAGNAAAGNESSEVVAARINEEIQNMCDAYVAQAQERAEEYKKAFLATGGTEEEWLAHNIKINVSYDIKNQTEDYLSFVVNGSENWSSAGSVTRYYNLDLKTWNYVTLKDMLGEDYIGLANESIKAQMEKRQKENSNITYWTPEEGGFTTVDEATSFYINEKGNPVVVFEKYEIGPGSLGMPEVEIERVE